MTRHYVSITPEEFAAHLRWLLGNHNFETDELDGATDAYETDNPLALEVNVTMRIPGTGEGGTQRFTVTVAEVADPPAAPELPGRIDPDAERQLADPESDVW